MTGSTETRAGAVVVLENITKAFGAVVAVDDLSLAIAPGQFVTLLGPSGCGKSTTLRLLGGFETPDRGRILLAGGDVTALPPNRRQVNMVFQDYALFPHLSVAQNVAFGLELKGQSRAEIRRRSGELFEFLQLTGLEKRLPHELSGGQRQRVALARALAPDPAVLLLDEPLGALDAKLRTQVQGELNAIQQRTGKTFVFVTHDQQEALTMSDRIVVMDQGRVMQDGSPEELYHHPANRFVADFIGETNFLTAKVQGEAHGIVHLDWWGQPLQVQRHGTGEPLVPGTTVEVALRPESIACHTTPPGGEAVNRYRGKVTQRLFQGSRVRLTVVVEGMGEGATLQATLDPAVAGGLTGESLWLAWSPQRGTILAEDP
ncbi:MAG: ABC transporter ATP-binding protein [Candidatus Competibacterales bacterium]